MPKNAKASKKSIRIWVIDECGSATILSLFFALISLVIGGIAVDFNKAMSERTQLQIAADTAAHAALYTRERKSSEEAKDVALSTINGMLPEFQFGSNALLRSDITFGAWDINTSTFTEDINSKTAVRVRAQMLEERSNASRNILLRIIGQDTFDIGVESIYSTYYPGCFTEGFVAEAVVDIQSNNNFSDGFCVHSNSYVSMNQNNYFESGTVVSMPDVELLDIPKSGFKKNEGLETALRQGEYRFRLLNLLPEIIDSFWTAKPDHLPRYVYQENQVNYVYSLELDQFPSLPEGQEPPKNALKLTPYHFEKGKVNKMVCASSGSITMDPGVYSEFVFITNCEINFANGVVLEDVVVATTASGVQSLYSPQGLQLGRNDGCLEGGGVTLMTQGGFKAAASLSVFNGQILALGDIEFAANADGVVGASFVSTGSITGTSNMDMGYCNNGGMENAYRAPYFRMVN